MKENVNNFSKLISDYNSNGKKIKVTTITGEFVGVICAIGGSSTISGQGGINNAFQIRNDNDEISDIIHLDHVLSIDVN